MIRYRVWACVVLLLLATPGCARFGLRPDAEALSAAQSVATAMAALRSEHSTASALVQATTETHGKLQLWPGFTAVLRYTAPNRTTIEGYSELGIPLFSFTSENGRYQFTDPAGNTHSGRLNSRIDPVARILTDLSHLMDGAVGIDLKGALPRSTKNGDWQIRSDGMTTTFRLDHGRVTHLTLNRKGRPPTTIEFSDFRPLEKGAVPYRITVNMAGYKARLSVNVIEWQRAPS